MKIYWEREDIGNLTVGVDKHNPEIVYLVNDIDGGRFNLDKINECGDSERILSCVNLDRLLLFFNTKQLKPAS